MGTPMPAPHWRQNEKLSSILRFPLPARAVRGIKKGGLAKKEATQARLNTLSKGEEMSTPKNTDRATTKNDEGCPRLQHNRGRDLRGLARTKSAARDERARARLCLSQYVLC